ncbi:MAG: hypothetical protein E7398_03735 [Ruminococcaceae bacterium]|nr:hypothetical protein [Oscillospiraceae bacterium]
MDNIVSVTRKTTESQMRVCLDFSGLRPDYRSKINTPFPFFSHMLEHIAWRSGVNIEVSIELDKFFLKHVVYEDLGITFGKAIREYILRNKKNGVVGFGDAIGIIDEAKAEVAISFEERALFAFSSAYLPQETEDVYSEDLKTFLDGVCQGGMCTLHMDIMKGENGHHIWEAAFRALGSALGRAFYLDETRKNMSSGVAGGIEFIIE